MPRIEYSIVINRPVDEVFNFVTDFRNHPKWQPDVLEVWQTEGRTRIGTMVTERRNLRLLFYQLDLNIDIIDYKLNRKVEYKGVAGSFPLVGSLFFDPSGYATRVTESFDLNMWGPHRLFSPMMAGMLRRRAETMWTALKKKMEAREIQG